MVLVFLAGICAGSFLNVCIYRIPQGKSVVFPPSCCPCCAHTLGFVDLIPVISYLALNKKCRYCGCQISPRYPAVELFAGLLFVLAVTKYGLTIAALRAVVLFSILIPAALIDLDHKIIPDKLNLAGIFLGIPLIVQSKELFFSSVAGFLAGGGLLLLIAVVSRGGMGGGDIKLAAVMGLLLGWKCLLAALFLAFAAGGVTGILLLLLKVKNRKDAIPFGPFLALGAIAAALAGDKLVCWYGGCFGF